jgi:hypothetical protein
VAHGRTGGVAGWAWGLRDPQPRPGYDRGMRYLPNILLVLSLPAGALGYTVGLWVMTALVPDLASGLLGLVLPLLLGGLCMMPLVIPFFDRKAKRDLAEYRAREASDEDR